MQKNYTLLLFFLGLLLQPAFAQPERYHPREFILQLKPGHGLDFSEGRSAVGLPAIDALNKELGVAAVRQVARSTPRVPRRHRPDTRRLLLLRFEQDIDVVHTINLYLATGLVEFAEPNYIGQGGGVEGLTPNDSFFSRQWSLKNDGTFDVESIAGADIKMEEAWELAQGNPDIIVAILDSGARLSHPELAGRLWRNSAEVPGNGQDDDQNGYVDDVLAWDFANDDNVPADDHGHGSNVSGIVAANGNNAIGYAGVDWRSQAMICKILDENNNGFYSWWVEGIYYAVDHGASVINMSVGGTAYSSAMKQAIDYAHANNVVVVACMMNTNQGIPFYPAAYANTIAVGATGTDDRRAAPFFWDESSGSNYGAHIDLVAPGNYIYGLDESSDLNYNSIWGGTSQAAPLVTGVATLMKGLEPGIDVETVRNILRATADDQVGDPAEDLPGWDIYYGAGRLNAFRALELLTNTVSVEQPRQTWARVDVYPNPARSSETAMLDVQVEYPQEVSFVIWDNSGRQRFSSRLRLDQHSRIPIPAGLPPGLHWAVLRTDEGKAISRKFLVGRY